MNHLSQNEIVHLNNLFFENDFNPLGSYSYLDEINKKNVVVEHWSRDTGHAWRNFFLKEPEKHTQKQLDFADFDGSDVYTIATMPIHVQILFWQEIKKQAFNIMVESFIVDIYDYVKKLFEEREDRNLTYHNWEHTKYVYEELKYICETNHFPWNKTAALLIASLFHDVGYLYGYDNHEDKSINIAQEYLKGSNIPKQCIDSVKELIDTTKNNFIPPYQSDKFLVKDIDISYCLGYNFNQYLERSGRLREEWKNTINNRYTDKEWFDLQHSFLSNITFYSCYGKENIEFRKVNYDDESKYNYPLWILEKLNNDSDLKF